MAEDNRFDLPPYQLRNLVCGIIWRDEHFTVIASHKILSESGIRKIIIASFDLLQAA
jgi:hypothetical protein